MKYLKCFVALFIMAGALNAMTREEFESAMAGAPVSTQQQVQSAAGELEIIKEGLRCVHSLLNTDPEALIKIVHKNTYPISGKIFNFQTLKTKSKDFSDLIKQQGTPDINMPHYQALSNDVQFYLGRLHHYHQLSRTGTREGLTALSTSPQWYEDLQKYMDAASTKGVDLDALGIAKYHPNDYIAALWKILK
jgi:hypothetical protein